MTELTTAWMLGFVCGFLLGVTLYSRPRHARNIDWRRSINHENTNRPSGPPPLGKPQPPGGRLIREDFLP